MKWSIKNIRKIQTMAMVLRVRVVPTPMMMIATTIGWCTLERKIGVQMDIIGSRKVPSAERHRPPKIREVETDHIEEGKQMMPKMQEKLKNKCRKGKCTGEELPPAEDHQMVLIIYFMSLYGIYHWSIHYFKNVAHLDQKT